MARKARIILLAMHAAFLPGCVGFGYTHHFEASARGVEVTGNLYSAYIHPLKGEPRNAVKFRDYGLTVACTNQEFDLLSVGFYELPPLPGHWPIVPFPLFNPIPNLHKIEVAMTFSGKAHTVDIDLRQIKLVLPDRTVEMKRARYFHKGGRRDDTLPLGAVILRDAMTLRFAFDVRAGRVGAFSLDMPPFRMDGRTVALPRMTFTKVGGFAYSGD